MQAQRCDDRQIIRISGADCEEFLQGMISNDIKKISDGLVYAALLTPQGKYLADFFLLADQGAVLLDIKAEMSAALIQRLTMYKLRADVTIAPADMPVWCGLGDIPEGAFPDPRHASLGWRFYGDADFDSIEIDWNALRVAACVPDSGVELIPNDTYLLEAGFEALNGVDFKKGCYVGQEVTARMKHKTELRKGLAQVEITGSAPVGTTILADGKPAGTLFTQASGHALAHLRFERAKGEMTAGDATLRLVSKT